MAIQPVEDPVEHAKAVLTKLVSLMGMEANVTEARLDQAENLLFIRFDCADSAVFTEENGRGLQALQFVLNSVVSRKREPHLALRLDTGGYWDSKEKEIARRVEEAVNEVKATDKPHRMDPMPASMRKIVHNLVKANYPGIETASEGEGRWRKVVIRKIEVAAAAPQTAEQPAEQPAEQTTEQK
jgi:spoIIIJ-associated protein